MAKAKTTLASLFYTRDNNGQLLSETSTGLPGGAQSFSYDTLNRLTQAASGSYVYDKADHPTTIAALSGFGYDDASQLIEGPSSSFSYDKLGERTGALPSIGSATSYAYDQAGRLTSVTRPSEGETPAIEDSFAYDGDELSWSFCSSRGLVHRRRRLDGWISRSDRLRASRIEGASTA